MQAIEQLNKRSSAILKRRINLDEAQQMAVRRSQDLVDLVAETGRDKSYKAANIKVHPYLESAVGSSQIQRVYDDTTVARIAYLQALNSRSLNAQSN